MCFIRPAGLCEMSTSLAWFTRHVELYKVLWSLYNIKLPCINWPDLWKPPDLCNIICSYRIADFVERWSAFEKFTRRLDLYKNLWSLYNIEQPAGLCEMFDSLAWFAKHVEAYKVLWSLYNIRRPCRNLQDLWKRPDLFKIICSYRIADSVERWSAFDKITRRVELYKVLWSSCIIKRAWRNRRTSAPYTLSTVLTESLWNIDRPWRNLPDVSTL